MSVYKSSTLGPIPLSFTGRHLLQSLREEIIDMVNRDRKNCTVANHPAALDWEPVSRARGRLAQYMSQLEKRPPSRSSADILAALSIDDLKRELDARYAVERRKNERLGWRPMMGKLCPPTRENLESRGWHFINFEGKFGTGLSMADRLKVYVKPGDYYDGSQKGPLAYVSEVIEKDKS